MFNRSSESDSHSSKQSFLLGERSLRAYFAGGNVRFLKDAEANFAALKPGDDVFDKARFFLGVAKTQLRKTDESIRIFEDLQERTSKSRSTLNAKLKDQVSLQLAYAQIKTYKQAGFDAAEADLFTAEMDASKAGDTELMLQAKSIRVFLYAVLAGHATEELRKLEGAKNAIQLGNELLEQAPEGSRPAVRFEALNALGIAWMRVGEAHWEAIGDKATSWAKAQKYYDEALEIIPNSLRVLQNLAKLRLLQVEQLKDKNARTLLEQAKEYCERSLDVSDQDMYPYYLLAQIEAKLGYLVKNEDERPYFMAAWEYVHIGRGRPGAVTEEQWAEVERTLPRSADSNQPYKR